MGWSRLRGIRPFHGLPAILELAVEDARRGAAYLAREGVLGGAA